MHNLLIISYPLGSHLHNLLIISYPLRSCAQPADHKLAARESPAQPADHMLSTRESHAHFHNYVYRNSFVAEKLVSFMAWSDIRVTKNVTM